MTDTAYTPPRAATLHLGGDAWAHPDLEPLVRALADHPIQRAPSNPRLGDHEAIVDSIRTNGVYSPVKVQRSTGYVLAGNHTFDAITDQGGTHMPWVWLDVDDDEARRIMLADNRTAELGGYDDRLLLEAVRAAAAADQLLAGTGYSTDDLAELERAAAAAEYTPPVQAPSLSDRFVVPPFTVLDQRAGAWQERKRQWLALGIQSEVGRGENVAGQVSEKWEQEKWPTRGQSKTLGAVQSNLDGVDAARYGRKDTRARAYKGLDAIQGGSKTPGRTLGQGLQAHRGADGSLEYTETTAAGVSIFDPVLTELAYRWFSPPGGHVLDPFAGGSVRGIVAAALGRDYTGIELRAEQVAANQAQLAIVDRIPGATRPEWVEGDSREVLPGLQGSADLLFSCPPYADLEVYSDDPADLSNMPYDEFLTAYRQIIAAAAARLREDRFAVWVIGEVRDKRGHYRGLVPDTIRAFTDAGLAYYNEAILVTPVGSLPIRAGRQFSTGRKLGKTHQNVLVFTKGDPRAAADACGTVDVTMPETTETLDA